MTSSFISPAFCSGYFHLQFRACVRVCVFGLQGGAVALRVCANVHVCVCVDTSLSGGGSRLQWPPSPCLAFPIFDSSKGGLPHSIIALLSDFLFVMITQNNKSEITIFVQRDEGDGQGFTLSYSLT